MYDDKYVPKLLNPDMQILTATNRPVEVLIISKNGALLLHPMISKPQVDQLAETDCPASINHRSNTATLPQAPADARCAAFAAMFNPDDCSGVDV